MLKALHEQQIATTSVSNEELKRLGGNRRGLGAIMSEMGQANPTTGTMHPAIQGMLARRGIAPSPAFPRRPSSSYLYNNPQSGGVDDTVQQRRGSVFNPNESQLNFSDRMRREAQSPIYYGGEMVDTGVRNPPYVGFAMPDRQYPAQQ